MSELAHKLNPQKAESAKQTSRHDIVIGVLCAVLTGGLFELPILSGLPLNPWVWQTVTISFAIGACLIVLARKEGANSLWQTISAGILFAISPFFLLLPSLNHPYKVLEYSSINWKMLVHDAEREVSASGLVLAGIDIDDLTASLERSRNLKVKLVLLDPEGHAIQARFKDEGPGAHDNQLGIRDKIRRFQVARASPGSYAWKDRFRLLVRDTYPTMAVVIIDEDLYVYFYSFGRKGTESPVFKFSGYKHWGSLPAFFEAHLVSSLDEKQGAYEPKNYEIEPISK